MVDRTPPNDEYAERVMIGLVMAQGQIPEAAQALAPSDFYRPRNEMIWVALRTLTRDDKPCDITTVRAYLQERELLNTRNGVSDLDLFEMLQNVPPAADAEHVAAIILDRAKRRTLIQVFERGLQSIHESPEDVDAQLEMLGKQLDQIPHAVNHILAGTYTADWLGQQTFDPLQWVVPEAIPEGYTLLIGAPKIGKSWFSLSVGLAASMGGYMFGKVYCGRARPVLLLALEDSHRRMQSRIRSLIPDEDFPPLLSYRTRVEPGAELRVIEDWLAKIDEHERPLIIVDTIGKLMPLALQGENQYQRDYRFSSALQRIAGLRPGMAVIGLHHDRKATADDFVESISGTNGIAGAADTILVIKRDRNEPEGLLKVTGRDIEESEIGIRLNEGRWDIMGDTIREAIKAARSVHATAGLGERSAEIVEFVNDHPDGVRAEAIVEEFDMAPVDARTYLRRLFDSRRIARPKRGLYGPLTPPVSSVSSVSKSDLKKDTEETDDTLRPARPRAREEIDRLPIDSEADQPAVGSRWLCDVCGEPMIVIEQGVTTHPNCGPS